MGVSLAAVRQPAAHSPSVSLRTAMRHLVGGVSLITAGLGAARTGATVISAHSLALEPETMIVTLNLSSSTWVAIRRFGHFCVNLLGEQHQPIAERFTGAGGLKGPARYEGAEWTTLATGAPVLVDALAAVDCELETSIERHTHAIVIGAVRAVRCGEGAALVYAHGHYGRYAT
jgi:flavin reductase (DIM6/NTAB) family NADH-FMN oxidoreductase RutF